MKRSIWVVNSFCIIVLFSYSLFVVFYKIHFPTQINLQKLISDQKILLDEKKNVPNLQAIYSSSLFGTQEKKEIVSTESSKKTREEYIPQNFIYMAEVPENPTLEAFALTNIQKPTLFPPLQYSLKGIILSSSVYENRAFIQNEKTKEESLYKLGDVLEDAQIINIEKDKVVFIRSNGQKETLYVNNIENIKESEDVIYSSFIKKNSDSNFSIDLYNFKKNIPTLGKFLESIDITTYFNNNIAEGCIIGSIEQESLADALGLKENDIIIQINNKIPNTSSSRVEIYKEILEKNKEDNLIQIMIKRNNQEMEYTYTLNFDNIFPIYDKKVGVLEKHAHQIYRGESTYREKKAYNTIEKDQHEIEDILMKQNHVDKKMDQVGSKSYAIYR